MLQNSGNGIPVYVAAVLIGALSSTACTRTAEETAPVAEMQTQSPVHEMERPVTVQGCLRAGEAASTFVVTSSADEGGHTTTYALTYPAGTAREDLRDHIGQQVHVEGVVRAQQAATSYTPPAPAAGEPVGTGGAPMVQTTTELAVQQLEVNSLRPLGQACGDR